MVVREAPAWNGPAMEAAPHSIDNAIKHCITRPTECSLHPRGRAFTTAARPAMPVRQVPREMAWREDHCRHSNGAQVQGVLKLVVSNPPSVDFRGYWQRSQPPRPRTGAIRQLTASPKPPPIRWITPLRLPPASIASTVFWIASQTCKSDGSRFPPSSAAR